MKSNVACVREVLRSKTILDKVMSWDVKRNRIKVKLYHTEILVAITYVFKGSQKYFIHIAKPFLES